MLDDGAPGGQTADVTEIGEEIGHRPILMRAADSAAVAVRMQELLAGEITLLTWGSLGRLLQRHCSEAVPPPCLC